ncbi:dual specificity protein phosphatase family protein [Clostridium sp. cel8]|jgi:protein-tyrosine phosphatase|uniref:fused DSP-PTPase phosphatase/NAD kinase-like protein n=1 Tax=Clostridium sp. cel8 TaxID=2663123 RepID=UPI0015F605C2|nr:dual specificity protein phosphatase family protein [Clostridium sp. cel8]MBA5851309.1 dual specificity protein phosphatase family protein [Clostridium sp. cel8]
MKKKFRIIAFILFFISIMGISTAFSKELSEPNNENAGISMTVDSKRNGKMPKRFRKASDKIETTEKTPNLTGLSDLKESGSAQFTPGNIDMVKKAIGSKNIVVVDLRQESHGFINGWAVSWKKDGKNKANKGLTKSQVLKTEEELLKSIKLNEPIEIKGKTIVPTEVQDEKQLVTKYDMKYVRIPVTDNERPDDDMVDYFVNMVKTLPEDTWFHFHCKAGIGRTTTFMAMYDMMKNAKKVSLEDIMERQTLIGGKEILKPENGKKGNSQRRSDFLRNFYEYAKQNNDNFETSWSKWLKSK